MTATKPFRLFLSSTFKDLVPEREHLVKKIFPQIRALCRERGVEFTEIDLRWGITEEEAQTGKTVRICLEEIDRCRPYFIGILGSRYGWIPSVTEIEKDAEMLAAYPWLREYAASNKSIVEMEMAHGALTSKNASAFFYEQVGTADAGLEKLKVNLRKAECPSRQFSTPEELGEHVLRDLTAILDRDWPSKKELSPLELERTQHEAFAQNRRQSYIANPEHFEAFANHVERADAPLIIWGPSGLGKSALMAYLANEYTLRHPEAFVVQHYIGASDGSGAGDVMRHVMMEIRDRYNLSDELPANDDAMREEFPTWLAKLRRDETLVLVIDALNQLTGVSREMHWLPEFIPANVRFVLSTTPEVPLEELRKRKWNELELQPLTATQVGTITTDFLSRYSKRLTRDQLDFISKEEKTRRPLFLRTVLEEVRLFGDFAGLTAHLSEFLQSADERDLFQHVLERMEHDHGPDNVRSVLSAIWASRHGLSETEMMEITRISRRTLSELMIAMEYHLMQREELHTFFHNHLREAVQERYLATADQQRAAHATLGEYFSTREFGARRLKEEPWQWQMAGNDGKLRGSLIEPEMVAMLDSDQERYEAFGYWRRLGRIGIDEQFVERLLGSRLPTSTTYRAFINAIDLLVLADEQVSALELCRRGGKEMTPLVLDREQRLWPVVREIQILNHVDKIEEVIDRIRELLADADALALLPKIKMDLLDNLAYAHYRREEYAEAELSNQTFLEMCGSIYGTTSNEYALGLQNRATYVASQGRFEEAELIYDRLVSDAVQQFGSSHPSVAYHLMQLATCRTQAGKLDVVVADLERAEEIFVRSIGPRHFRTCICRSSLAWAKILMTEFAAARSILTDVVAVMVSTYPNHKDTLKLDLTIGYTHFLEGNLAAAIPYYQRIVPQLETMLGSNNPEVVRGKNRLEEMLRAEGSQ